MLQVSCSKKQICLTVSIHMKNVSRGTASVQDALEELKKEDRQQFPDNREQWNCNMDNQMFDLIRYSNSCCRMDCKVIYGWIVFFFRDLVLEHTELDVDSYITIRPLASSFMLKSGCYETVFQISGVLQRCISRCVVGGRAMYKSYKLYHVKK